MNTKVKTLIGIILFIAMLGGAYFAYDALSTKNRPDPFGSAQNETNNTPVPSGTQEPSGATPAVTAAPNKTPDGESTAQAGGQEEPSVTTPATTGTPDVTPAEGDESEAGEEDKLAAFDFTVYDAAGNEVKLSDFFGKPIIINFWTTWCPYCVDEMPVFEEAYKKYGDEINFLMIDCVDGQRETQAMGESFIEEKGFTFPVYFDTEGSAGTTYEVYSLPTSVFIDRDGYVIVYYPGGLTAEMLQKGIDLVLQESQD